MDIINPTPGFHFVVSFINPLLATPIDMAFQSVTGLEVSINTETLAEGGENRFTHSLPGRQSLRKPGAQTGHAAHAVSADQLVPGRIDQFQYPACRSAGQFARSGTCALAHLERHRRLSGKMVGFGIQRRTKPTGHRNPGIEIPVFQTPATTAVIRRHSDRTGRQYRF